jgi:hypothetical protein
MPWRAATAFLYTYSTKQKIDLHEKGPFCLPRLFITIIIIIIIDTIIIIIIIILAQMEDSIAEGK